LLAGSAPAEKLIIAGMNTSNPIATAVRVATKVAVAATSFTFLAFTEYSNETISTRYSIAVFNNSNPITSPIANTISDHSIRFKLKTTPKIITTIVVKR